MHSSEILLIVRERLRHGREDAYGQNERRLASVSATLNCPHPYLALASMTRPPEVWWLNAFASEGERDRVEAAYQANEPLMAALRPLGARKEEFREIVASTVMTYREDLSHGSRLQIAGARFFVIVLAYDERTATGAVFESAGGERFVVATAAARGDAARIAERSGPDAMIFSVRPQWSFPADSWIQADPEFWKGAE